MRARTLIAVSALVMVTTVWSAPAALAAESQPPNPAPPSTSVDAGPDQGDPGRQPPPSDDQAPPGADADEQREQAEDAARKAAEDAAARRDAEEDAARKAEEAAKQQQQQIQAPPTLPVVHEATLRAPDTILAGESFEVRVDCGSGVKDQPLTVSGPVRPDGGLFKVNDDARDGDRIAFDLTCKYDDNAEAKATETVKVTQRRGDGGYDGKAWLDLDPNSGERGDEVDVRAYCPGNGDARLESDALEDITLKRRGDRLYGETEVVDDADFGRDFAYLICDNGDRDRERFYVRRDDIDEELDLDPGHGKRGDEIDVYVQCNDELGRLESDVLEDIELDRDGRYYEGMAKVEDDAERGEHTVKIKCGDDYLEEEFFVHGDDEDSDGGEQTTVYPKGAPETGGGSGDIPLGALALGLTGVLGAGLVGAGAFVDRRAARR